MKALLVAVCFALPLQAAAQPYYPEPPGHADLIARRPDLAYGQWAYWHEDMDLLRRVNRDINAAMIYRSEAVDVWGSGADCDDYAVRKLETLIRAGVPRGAMRLAVGTVSGRGHAVLVVREYWVLDNRRDDIYWLGTSSLRIKSWESEGGTWSPAVAFASLADHLRRSKSQ